MFEALFKGQSGVGQCVPYVDSPSILGFILDDPPILSVMRSFTVSVYVLGMPRAHMGSRDTAESAERRFPCLRPPGEPVPFTASA